ncbi:MAG: DUF4349 domain-containing protein [Bacteroidetes bacterium]|nr:DUF4349 domain-containing protein [Bacteroidota bacterium]
MSKTTALCCTAAAALAMTFSCSQSKKAPVEERTILEQPANRSEHSPAGTEIQRSAAKEESEHSLQDSYAASDAANGAASEQEHSAAPAHDLSSAAAAVTDHDGMRFVRTADIRFEVRDVAEATYAMEDITTHYGGFVTHTDLHSTIQRQETVQVSEDSSLELTWYTVENDITLRIPATRMDSALRAMTPLVGFLDHRTISADEVSGRLLAEAMKQQRNAAHERRMNNAVDNHQVKSDDLTQVAEAALTAREQADDAILAARTMENQIRYSTLHFVVYQHEAVRRLRIASPKAIPHYERPLLMEAWEAAQDGWYILRHVLVFMIRCWAFVLVGIAGYMLYRLRRRG